MSAVRTLPVVVELPFRQEHVEINRYKVIGAKFDSILFQVLLDDDSKEFTPPIRLNALNGERHFLKDTIKEIQRIIRSAAGIYAQNPITGTIINGGVLIYTRCDFAGIHLHPFTGNRALITREVDFAAIFYQRLCLMTAKNFVNGCDREGNAMKPFQLALNSSGPQVAFATQRHDKFFKVRPNLGSRRAMGASVLTLQPFDALCLIPFPPFVQSWARNSTTPTNKTGVSRFLIKFDPLKALSNLFFHEERVSTN